ncbi:E3 ubiquitin-protein ligase MARCHF11 isoform 2-T2 [Synchiropus picturatus]
MSAEEGGGPAGGGVQEETSSPSTCEEAGTTAGALRPGEDLEPDPGEEDGGAGVESCRSNGSGEGCSPPTPSCRICFQGAEQGEMFNPCRCDGTVRYTHHHCLLKWISERGCWTCELCCYRFHVVPVNMKRPWQWQSITVTLVEKVQMVAVFLGSLFLVASISWLLWSALSPNAVWQRRDLLFQICYGMYGVMDLVCVGLIVHEGAAVCSVFLRWRAVNLHWDVQSYDKTRDLKETQAARTLWLPLTAAGPAGQPDSTQLDVPAWTCLCLTPFFSGPGSQNRQSQEGDSGEVVIRVTSV